MAVQIWFESDMVWMVHSDLQAQPGSWLRWTYTDADGPHPMPYLEVYTWKNKTGGGDITFEWANQAFFQLNRLTSSIAPVEVSDLPLRPDRPDDREPVHVPRSAARHLREEPSWSTGSGC